MTRSPDELELLCDPIRVGQALANWLTTRFATAPAMSRLRRSSRTETSSSMSPTTAKGSRPASCRTFSSASAARTRRDRAAVTGSGWRSSRRSRTRTAAAQAPRTATAAALTSGSRCRRRRHESGEGGSGKEAPGLRSPGSAAPAAARIETRSASSDSLVELARRRASVAKATLGVGGAVVFGGAMLFARISFAGHPKGPPRPLAAPPRFVSIVRENLLQACIVAPRAGAPGATTSDAKEPLNDRRHATSRVGRGSGRAGNHAAVSVVARMCAATAGAMLAFSQREREE